ncbi:MAG: hypothetical protein K6G92_14155 [Bacteroidaceae bacterium]|nr:hypothetical protein [Bacteroidaceae bacterium]
MATFDFFRNVRSTGVICTRTLFEGAVQAPALRKLLQQIAAEPDDERRAELKKRLPVVTWQAHFPSGRRKNADAQPSGLFMVDIDHVDAPRTLYEERVKPHLEDLRILAVHLTPSTRGLRIVAVCDPALTDIAANQQHVADVLGVEIDAVCKDLARRSFLVSMEYFYYLDEAIWEASPQPSPKGKGGEASPQPSPKGKGAASAAEPSPKPSATGTETGTAARRERA